MGGKMKAVLISIQPKWCELIASGKKTVEVRKTKPKLETPFKVYIYETKALYKPNGCRCFYEGKGKVIGEFVCDKVYDLKLLPKEYYGKPAGTYEQFICENSCLSFDDIKAYGNGKSLYGWHISDLVIYDKPKELSEFKRFCDGVGGKIGCRGCPYYYVENNESSGRYEACCCDNLRPITRAFQSWGYVEAEE
jgi:predicted transcriptional regulator